MKFKNIKYAHPGIAEVIRFSSGTVSSLVIENQDFFRQLCQDFYFQSQGIEGEGILSSDDNILDMSKFVEPVFQYVPFEINTKSLQTKLISALEHTALSAENFMQSQSMLMSVQNSIYNWAYSLDVQIEIPKLSLSAILKASGVQFFEGDKNDLEKILDFMDIVREFDREKLFVFFQLRSYFNDEQVELFLKTAINRDFTLLLVDSTVYRRFEFEKRLIIDSDLCLI